MKTNTTIIDAMDAYFDAKTGRDLQKDFIVTVKHDKGTARLRVRSLDESEAVRQVCKAENCPESAIIKIRPAAYSRTIDKIIDKVDCRYGSPMGRSNVGERPTDKRIFDCAVPMYSDGAYDKGGAYWGIGNQLRVRYTKDLSFIEFYRKGE